MAIHIYAANRSMTDRCFYNADGEMLIVPQQGRARFVTELGIIEAAPGEIVIVAARPAFPGGAAGRAVARLYLRELWRHAAAARARTARRQRACQSARFPRPGRSLRRHAGSAMRLAGEVPGQSVGGGDGPLAAQRRRLARQPRALQIRPRALHDDRHGELRSSRSVDLQRAHRAVRPRPAPPISISSFSRRAGSSPRTRSGRRGFIAT